MVTGFWLISFKPKIILLYISLKEHGRKCNTGVIDMILNDTEMIRMILKTPPSAFTILQCHMH